MKRIIPIVMALTLGVFSTHAQSIWSAPLFQNFENGWNGWSLVDGDGDGHNWGLVDMSQYELLVQLGFDLTAYDGQYIAASASSTTDASGMGVEPLHPSNWLISPEVELDADWPLTLSWYCRIFSADYPGDRYEVLLSTSGSDTSDFTTLLFTEVIDFASYTQRTVSLSDFIGQTVRIAFHHFNCTNNSTIMLDRISIFNGQMPEVQITGPTSIPVGDTVTFTATQTNGATSNINFEWEVENADYLSSTTGQSVNIAWNEMGYYTVRVILTNDYGTDTAEILVRTYDCGPVTNYPYRENFSSEVHCWSTLDQDDDGETWMRGNGYAISYSNAWFYSDPQDNWLLSQPFQLGDGDYVLSWNIAARDENSPAEHYSVMVSTADDPDNTSAYQTLFSETLSEGGSFSERYVRLDNYAGQQIYIAFRHHATQRGSALMMTNFEVSEVGAPRIHLHVPSHAIAGDEVEFTLDTFSFSPITDITWTVALDAYGNSYQESASTPFFYQWDADAEEGYYWVKVSATNDLGTAYDSARFYLYHCDIIDQLPYHHNFGNDELCWRNNGWQTGQFSLEYKGQELPAAVSFSSDYRGNPINCDNRLASPYIHLDDQELYELKYIVAEGAITGDHYSVVVRYEGNTDTLLDETLSQTDPSLRKLSLEAYANTDIQIEFYHHDNQSGYAIMIADVEIRPISAPSVKIIAPGQARSTDLVTLRAEVVSAAEVDYEWTLPGGDPQIAYDSTIDVQWHNGGNYAIILKVNNSYGDAADTVNISITQCLDELDIPTTEHFEQGIGCWNSLDDDGDGYGWEDVMSSVANDGSFNTSILCRGTNSMISFSALPIYDMLSFFQYGLGRELNTRNALCSPAISLPEGQSCWMTYFVVSIGEYSTDLDSYEIRIATSQPQTLSDYDIVIRPMSTAPGDHYTQVAVDLSQYSGQTIWVAFIHQSQGKKGLLIDDIAFSSEYVGIEQRDGSNISIFPNPTTNILNINAEELLYLELNDQNGRQLLYNTTNKQLDLTPYPAGIYMLRIATTQGICIKKIVKQ